VILVSPPRISFECKAGEVPKDQQIRVSATWPKLAYRLTVSNAAWLTATPEHGSTPRQGSAMAEDIAHLSVDTTGLKPDHYNATITVSSWQALRPIQVDVSLTVK
jgi:hypothetical protein